MSTVVILVLPQMVDAPAPVQPWTLKWPTPVTQDTHCRDQTGEPASPMDSGVGAYLDVIVSYNAFSACVKHIYYTFKCYSTTFCEYNSWSFFNKCVEFDNTASFISPVVNCGDPGSPSNGQRTGSSTTYNSVVTYTCNTGYTLTQGSNRRTCQSNGQWSGTAPRCNRKLSLYL